MAKLGLVADDQFESELQNSAPNGVVNKVPFVLEAEVIEKKDRGRGIGNVSTPKGLQKLIGETSVLEGREAAINLAKDFGISESSVSAYAKGATSTASYNNPDSSLTKYLTNRKNRASKKALRALHATLDQITPDKLSGVSKVRDLAGIAKDLATVAKNMEPESTTQSESNKPQFIVYAPSIRDERSYETIVVNDNY